MNFEFASRIKRLTNQCTEILYTKIKFLSGSHMNPNKNSQNKNKNKNKTKKTKKKLTIPNNNISKRT